jgi:aminoglycoside 6'-N-acetyltransferase
MQAEYQFRHLTRADLPMIGDWLASPHIGGWWGTPEKEIALMIEDIGNPVMDMRVVCLDGIPFAYVQDYPAHHWPMPQYADQPAGTRAVDTFLGDATFLGKGHAKGYLRQRASEVIDAGSPRVVVDPAPDNTAAVATYRAAGFHGNRIAPCEDGDPVLILEFTGSAGEGVI